MLLYNFTPLLLVLYTSNAFCAVLTATTNVYIPLNHGITRPASKNGVLSFVGGDNSVSTFIFTEPQNTEFIATVVDGEGFVILALSAGPNEILSISCAEQATDAVCLVYNTNPADHLFAFSTLTDTLDSVALLEIGLPAPAPTPAPLPPPRFPSNPSAGGNQNDEAGGGQKGQEQSTRLLPQRHPNKHKQTKVFPARAMAHRRFLHSLASPSQQLL